MLSLVSDILSMGPYSVSSSALLVSSPFSTALYVVLGWCLHFKGTWFYDSTFLVSSFSLFFSKTFLERSSLLWLTVMWEHFHIAYKHNRSTPADNCCCVWDSITSQDDSSNYDNLQVDTVQLPTYLHLYLGQSMSSNGTPVQSPCQQLKYNAEANLSHGFLWS